MLDQIFTYTDADLSVSEAEEASLIAAAQAGDDDAKMTLLYAYGPVLRRAVSAISRNLVQNGTLDVSEEDLQGAAMVGFFEVLADHDPARNPRIAGRVYAAIRRHLVDEVTGKSAFVVPERTLSRFHGILKTYDGDFALAEQHAPDHGMSRGVFRDIYEAAHGTASLDGLTAPDAEGVSREFSASPVYTTAPVVDVEDKILVEVAFAAVDDEEARVCSLAYGFTPIVEHLDGERVDVDRLPSDEEIGQIVGMTRPTVQRRRAKALGKMRKALGVDHA